MASLDVHGYSVSYDDSSKEGIDYLYNLSYEKAKALFEKAAVSGYKLSSSGGGM